MAVVISFDYTDEDDKAFILELLGGSETAEEPEEEAPAPRTRKAKVAPEPEPADGPTLEDAIALATELVAEGRTADIKAALTTFGVKRVGELEESQVADFVAALSEDAVV